MLFVQVKDKFSLVPKQHIMMYYVCILFLFCLLTLSIAQFSIK
jgi:hypothetical protein